MEFEDLIAPLAGDFEIEAALEDWRWLVAGQFRSLAVTALGDLFMASDDGTVNFLNTSSGKCARVADSVEDWERTLRDTSRFLVVLSDPSARFSVPEQEWEHALRQADLFDEWFMPEFVFQLRERVTLCQGECYSPLHSPILGGQYIVENWQPTNWHVHFSYAGRLHQAVKDVPPGTLITSLKYTEL